MNKEEIESSEEDFNESIKMVIKDRERQLKRRKERS
jgi:hypothetical protein